MKARLVICKKALSKNGELFKKLNRMISNNLIELEIESTTHLYYVGDKGAINELQEWLSENENGY